MYFYVFKPYLKHTCNRFSVKHLSNVLNVQNIYDFCFTCNHDVIWVETYCVDRVSCIYSFAGLLIYRVSQNTMSQHKNQDICVMQV